MKRLFLIITTLALPLFADEAPCAKDRDTFCKGVDPGHGNIMKCLKEHESELSGECKIHRDKMKEEMKEAHEACKEDREKFCTGKEKRDLMKCMKENKEKFSEKCKTEWKEMKEMRHKHKGKEKAE